MIINDLFTNKKTKVSEGMAGKVVFSGTGADGGTYEIIQSSPTDFMIHANGKHIDTYGSLQRAMSVLKNEVQGLQQGMAEGKIKLSTDPNWYGAEVGDYKASGPVVNIPANRLVGFEPDDKMNQPASKANVEKIVAGLKQGAKLPPLMVRQYKNGYQVLDGHHRFWAYKLLGVKSIPVQVVPAEDIEEITKQGMAEGQTDYQKRRQRERDVDAGKPVKPEPKNPQNDYFARRKKEKEQGVSENQDWMKDLSVRAAAKSKPGTPYVPPKQDAEKQRRDLTARYPNIDELVRQAKLNRDPNYDRAEGEAYYRGRDAEHNYHRLKQIQRIIRGAELDEMTFGGVNQTTDSATGDVTTSFNQGPVSVSQTKTPGGYTKQTDQQVNLGTATLGARTVGPNIGAGQLAGTTTKTATNNMTGQAKQQVKGVGFGGATGATVGKNYVGASDDELARLAADSVTGINEEPNQATVNVPGSSFTADKNTNTVSGQTNVGGATLSATKNITPGGGGSVSASMQAAPNLNITATQKSADYNKGQLAGTKSVSAKYTDTTGALGKPGQQHTATRTAGIGFGGATGANVGKNYVDQYSVNESVDRIRHLAGIRPAK